MNLLTLVPAYVGSVTPDADGAQVSFVALDETERHWSLFVPSSLFPFRSDQLRSPLFVRTDPDDEAVIIELVFGTPTVRLARRTA